MSKICNKKIQFETQTDRQPPQGKLAPAKMACPGRLSTSSGPRCSGCEKEIRGAASPMTEKQKKSGGQDWGPTSRGPRWHVLGREKRMVTWGANFPWGGGGTSLGAQFLWVAVLVNESIPIHPSR